jgi:predicted HNH restriction endonuclease
VCGFDFDDFYGSELAREYIEIHHTQSITAGARVPDPATDLIPLCSNCHSMVHRERGKILPVAALRARIMKRHAPNGEF